MSKIRLVIADVDGTLLTPGKVLTDRARGAVRRLLDAGIAAGYLREWQPPGVPASRHLSYAVQWWGFGVLLLVLYFALNLRKVP